MDADVLVVGAGPTGLLLAGDLAEAGVHVTILERRPAGVSNVTRAFGVHARTLEQMDMRGMAVTGKKVESLRLFGQVHIDLKTLPSRYDHLLITPQYVTERALQDRVDRLGVKTEYGAEVVGLVQDDSGVTVSVRDLGTRRAAYVVGADGVRSAVRSLLDLPFPGKSVLKSIMLADVRLTTPPAEGLSVNAVGDGFAMVAPFGEGWYRVFAWDRLHQVADKEPLELDEIRAVVRRALGTDMGMHDARWMSRFHSDERQVPRYRVGRVFLAGDAAHCHSPAGGQGMNTGMQDAANLGWKLAAVLRGRASDNLLDTYQAERHPVGKLVLRSSGAIIRAAMVKSRLGQAIRNAIGAFALNRPKIAARAAGTISGIGIRYAAPKGAAKQVGARAADMALTDGRLFEALRGGNFVLVTSTDMQVPDWVKVVRPKEKLAQPILVRPDGYIAWIGNPADYFARL